MSEQTYPCDQCGKPRTKAEGGTVFTVCDGCWKIAALEAENAKMRKALERISRHDPNKISLVYDIAREALK